MTTVEIRFRYQGPLKPELFPRIQESHRDFGLRSIALDESQKLITVEYDATRQDGKGVEAVLRRHGIPVVEQIKS